MFSGVFARRKPGAVQTPFPLSGVILWPFPFLWSILTIGEFLSRPGITYRNGSGYAKVLVHPDGGEWPFGAADLLADPGTDDSHRVVTGRLCTPLQPQPLHALDGHHLSGSGRRPEL